MSLLPHWSADPVKIISMKTLFTFAFVLCSFYTQAQPDAWFVNSRVKKAIRVSVGQILSVSYHGYLGQKDYVKAPVTDINDSMITLGTDPALLPGFIRKSAENNPRYVFRKIFIRDIIAFRRITAGRQLLKSSLVAGSIVGSFFLFKELNESQKYKASELFWISLGSGLGSSYLINAMFPETPKYRMEQDWRVVVSWDEVKP